MEAWRQVYRWYNCNKGVSRENLAVLWVGSGKCVYGTRVVILRLGPYKKSQKCRTVVENVAGGTPSVDR